MCGRYVLAMRPTEVRQRLALDDMNMPTDEAPSDDSEQLRQSYNFAPGYHGLIYRADTADRSAEDRSNEEAGNANTDAETSPRKTKASNGSSEPNADVGPTKYKLQSAKWGLIPFWTKRSPTDYGSQMRTINCRDDSLIENKGMWNTMKQRKRCVVLAEGFYEWLKKNNGKEKIPHYNKRKDGKMMCFAGLWDMVQYEGSEEKLYTYTIITTDSNKQLKFLHDRMPVILEPGSDAMKTWLDPNLIGWNKELQSMLKPFEGELECYPVDKAVGKVGNNSPQFVVPIDSADKKSNIANFFGTQRATAKEVAVKNEIARKEGTLKSQPNVTDHLDENRDTTVKVESTEDNAPLPKPKGLTEREVLDFINEDTAQPGDKHVARAAEKQVDKGIKREIPAVDDQMLLDAADTPVKKAIKTEQHSPSVRNVQNKPSAVVKTRSATSNNNVSKTPQKGSNAKITSFGK